MDTFGVRGLATATIGDGEALWIWWKYTGSFKWVTDDPARKDSKGDGLIEYASSPKLELWGGWTAALGLAWVRYGPIWGVGQPDPTC